MVASKGTITREVQKHCLQDRKGHPGTKANARCTLRGAGFVDFVRLQPHLGPRSVYATGSARYRSGQLAPGRLREVALDFKLPAYAISAWWHNRLHNDLVLQWAKNELLVLVQELFHNKSLRP